MASIFKQICPIPEYTLWPHLYTCPNPNQDVEADKDFFSNVIHMNNFTKEPVTKWRVIKDDKNGPWKIKWHKMKTGCHANLGQGIESEATA